MKVSVRSGIIVGVAAVVGIGVIGVGVNSSTPRSVTITSPQIQLAGLADNLFPGVGQAAGHAATEANETGDPRKAAANQLPTVIPGPLSIETVFLPVGPEAAVIGKALNVVLARLLRDTPDAPTDQDDDITPLEFAISANVVEQGLSLVGIDINDTTPNEVAAAQSVLDKVGVDFNVQTALDSLVAAEEILATRLDSPVYGLNGRVLDIVDNGTANGTRVQMWDHTGAENQQWTMNSGGNQIVNPHTQKCLDVVEAVNSSDLFPNGVPIQISDCGRQTSEQWRMADEVTDGNPVGGAIINLPSGKCLDVTDNVSANGTRLQLWDCTGGFNQQWNFPPYY
ncbi:RICIN domain-containing protein [Rhodococcus marinonascens]|uniref:RICIN domain-containing protein n=1 Tax=Rhodococcus marinonascens TaxID=38311 RepID=UPI000933E56D|nr:RICIN domain-containing protein [Rhodococcus marinonascens]